MAGGTSAKGYERKPQKEPVRRWDLSSMRKVHMAVHRIYRLYSNGSISGEQTKNFAMLLRLSGEFYQRERVDETEQRLQRIEAALNIEHGLSIVK